VCKTLLSGRNPSFPSVADNHQILRTSDLRRCSPCCLGWAFLISIGMNSLPYPCPLFFRFLFYSSQFRIFYFSYSGHFQHYFTRLMLFRPYLVSLFIYDSSDMSPRNRFSKLLICRSLETTPSALHSNYCYVFLLQPPEDLPIPPMSKPFSFRVPCQFFTSFYVHFFPPSKFLSPNPIHPP